MKRNVITITIGVFSVILVILISSLALHIVMAADVILGDADGSGEVTVRDATLIQKHSAGLAKLQDEQLVSSDVNADGTINVRDATAVQRHLAGLLTDSSIGQPIEVTEFTSTIETAYESAETVTATSITSTVTNVEETSAEKETAAEDTTDVTAEATEQTYEETQPITTNWANGSGGGIVLPDDEW